MSPIYVILFQIVLTLFTTSVWTQSSKSIRNNEDDRGSVLFVPRKFLLSNQDSSESTEKGGPVAYKFLNTVLAHLESARSQDQSGYSEMFGALPSYSGEDLPVFPEYTESLPDSEFRELRHIGGIQRHFSICRVESKIVPLNNEEYEYRPAHYEEIKCVKNEYDPAPLKADVCSSLGFSCIQWNKTIHLTRRRYSSDIPGRKHRWVSHGMASRDAGLPAVAPKQRVGIKHRSAKITNLLIILCGRRVRKRVGAGSPIQESYQPVVNACGLAIFWVI